jgi:YggT family protein
MQNPKCIIQVQTIESAMALGMLKKASLTCRQQAASARSSGLPARLVAVRASSDEPSTSSSSALASQAQQPLRSGSRLKVADASAAASAAAAASLLVLAAPAGATTLDGATAHLLADILRPTFALFTLLYIIRIPMTWFPNIEGKEWPWVIAYAPTEPVLSATRKVVPLVGGVDITPIVWVGLISFFNEILLGPQGLLILVERQGGI